MQQTIKLYQKQQDIVDKTISLLAQSNSILNNNLYLSGEMGVGKTYMGAYLANYYAENQYKILVVSPKVNIKKWQSLLNQCEILNKNSNQISNNISLISLEDINLWTQNLIKLKQNQLEDKFVLIFDEIHLALNTKYEAFVRIINMSKDLNDFKGIYLTGTLLEGNREIIARLISTTHPNLAQQYSIFNLLHHSRFPTFIYNVLQKISLSISLEDVQSLEANKEEIKQEMKPIVKLPVTTEQQLFLNVIRKNAQSMNINNLTIQSLMTSYVDHPSRSLEYNRKLRPTKNNIPSGHINYLALPLSNIELSLTEKYQHTLDLIKNSNDDKILIYANDKELIEDLKNQFIKDGFSAFTLGNSIKIENYSQYINEKFKTHKIAIINPLKVNVGVDIHAEQLIWYQMMPRLDKMIQAQRRVCRLSSNSKSLVTLLAYDIEFEMEKALELSNASKHNALTYGVKQKDSLAQLTGILLNNIK